MFQIFRQGENEVLIASKARWDEQLKGLIELERRCLTLREEVEHLSERQEVLADLMVSKKDRQKVAPEDFQRQIFQKFKELEEQKTKEVLELKQRKHKLFKWVGERRKGQGSRKGWRCREQQVHGLEATTVPLVVLAHLPWPSTRMAQEVDEAMSESSWTSLAKGKERDWWSIDLEGEVEKLEVSGPWSGTKGDSAEPKGEVDRKSDRAKVTREEKEKFKEDEMEVDVDALQGESLETKSSTRKVIREESDETQDYVCGTLAISQEEAEEIAFCAECP